MEKIPTWQPVVAAAFRDNEGRWLMHERPAGKRHAGLWEFPGGKVEPGETPLVALVREVEEELALVLPPAAAQPACFAQERLSESAGQGQPPIVLLLYTVAQLPGKPVAREGRIGWFTCEEIAALDKPPLDAVLIDSLFALFP